VERKEAWLLQHLEDLEARWAELEQAAVRPEALHDPRSWERLGKERATMQETLNALRRYKRLYDQEQQARELLAESSDEELRQLATADLDEAKTGKAQLDTVLTRLLIPRDPRDDKPVIAEVRAGTGGEEAALFAADLARMYLRYAERHRWKNEVLSGSPSAQGGYKEIILSFTADGAYGMLKYESGVHRVQRVPTTESSGRIHTSTATVAVLPEAEPVEVDVNVEKDIKMDTFIASSAGGQHMQKNETAVRLTHLPTGLVATCQAERSQKQNRERAMRILLAKILEQKQAERDAELLLARRGQIGTGERSEKIRTYNFPQSRVTDHRVGLSFHNLTGILDGDLDEVLTAIRDQEQERRLQEMLGDGHA